MNGTVVVSPSPIPNGSIKSNESFKSAVSVNANVLDNKPTIPHPYNPKNACDDLPAVRCAIDMFQDSYMLEAEEYLNTCDPDKFDHLLSSFPSEALMP